MSSAGEDEEIECGVSTQRGEMGFWGEERHHKAPDGNVLEASEQQGKPWTGAVRGREGQVTRKDRCEMGV